MNSLDIGHCYKHHRLKQLETVFVVQLPPGQMEQEMNFLDFSFPSKNDPNTYPTTNKMKLLLLYIIVIVKFNN